MPTKYRNLPSTPFSFEQSARRAKDRGACRFVGGTVGPVVFLTACYEQEGSWPWSDILSIAQAQVLTSERCWLRRCRWPIQSNLVGTIWLVPTKRARPEEPGAARGCPPHAVLPGAEDLG
jgi:hypothetical protein